VAEAGGAEAGSPAPVVSLERALDQVLDFLGRTEQTARVRALAIEARRLRGAVGKWRSIEPSDDTREEMVTRVLRLANDAEDAVAETRGQAGSGGGEARQSNPAMQALAQNPSLASANPKATLLFPGLPRDAAAGQRPAEVNRYAPPGAGPAIPDLGGGARGAAPAQQPSQVPNLRDLKRTLSISFQAPNMQAPQAPNMQAPQAVPDLTLQAPGAGRGLQQPRPSPAFGAEAPARPADPAGQGPRVPSLQFERVAPPVEPALPQAPVRQGSRPDIPAPAREIAERMAAAEEPAWTSGPPSLQPPPSSPTEDADTELFTLPTGVKELQALSVHTVRRPEQLDPHLVMITEPYSKRADAYRGLRRRLASSPARIIAVTSARPKEGKTICAVNLALALAESSPRNVLVVEANIRSPGLSTTLKFEPPVCFSEQLRRRRKDEYEPWEVVEQAGPDADESAGQTSIQGGAVHLLAIDPRTQRPPMLDAVGFSRAIESLKRAGYEYIIIDTPAVLGTMDMQIIGDVVEGVIFTSIVKQSNRGPLRDAITQIKPAPVLGVVVLES